MLNKFSRVYFVGKRSLSTSGKIYAKGVGIFGALGVDQSLVDCPNFTAIPSLPQSNVRKVATGWGHSAAITNDGQVYTWGRCFDFTSLLRLNRVWHFSSALARFMSKSTNSSLFGGEEIGFHPLPTLMSDLNNVVDVACSAGLTLFLDAEGQVYGWGANQWNQCGTKTEKIVHIYDPILVPVPPCQKIEAGLQHVLALTKEGEIYAWGKCNKGQAGFGSTEEIACLPKKITLIGPSGKKLRAIDISAGFNHSSAIAEDGSLYVWGKQMSVVPHKDNKIGMLKKYENQFTPRRVKLPSKAVQICSSNFALVIRTEDRRLYCMGLGEHDRNMISDPLLVTIDPPEGYNENVPPPTLELSSRAELRKGYQHVFLHSPPDSDANIYGEDNPYGLFDVILHGGEAYVLPWKGLSTLPEDVLATAKERKGLDVVDYSAGWRHELIVVK
eukprot:scaffold1510_cov176-Ochromonas_danica.AAC.5